MATFGRGRRARPGGWAMGRRPVTGTGASTGRTTNVGRSAGPRWSVDPDGLSTWTDRRSWATIAVDLFQIVERASIGVLLPGQEIDGAPVTSTSGYLKSLGDVSSELPKLATQLSRRSHGAPLGVRPTMLQ